MMAIAAPVLIVDISLNVFATFSIFGGFVGRNDIKSHLVEQKLIPQPTVTFLLKNYTVDND